MTVEEMQNELVNGDNSWLLERADNVVVDGLTRCHPDYLEWITELTEKEIDQGQLRTRLVVLKAGENAGDCESGDLLIDFYDTAEDDGIVLSVREQLMLRDFLNQLHPVDIKVQGDY